MTAARNVTGAARGLRGDGGSGAGQADELGVAAARIAEASADRIADRLPIRLGAWTLAVVAVATAIVVAALRFSLA